MAINSKEEYDQMFGLNKYQPKEISFKEKQIEYLLRLRPDYKEWRLRKLSSKQLYTIGKSQGFI